MTEMMVAGGVELRDDEANRALVEALHPPDWVNPSPAARYDMVVLGGGVAGLICASVANGLGARVALVERSLMGGDCLNFGCVPSKTLLASAAATHARRGLETVDAEAIWERVRAVRASIAPHDSAARFRDMGIDVFLGQGRFTGRDTLEVGAHTLHFRRAVIATGAQPFEPPIPGLDAVEALSNESVFELDHLPSRLAIVGGGAIGCEMAQAFTRLGTEVTLLEMAPHVLPLEDPEASQAVASALEAEGVRVLAGVTVTQVELTAASTSITWRSAGRAETGELSVDRILLATGRRARVSGLGLGEAGVERDEAGELVLDDGLRTSNPRIYAAGDVALKARFTHAADASARLVVRNALFPGAGKASALRIPHCTYTDPELAHVGLTADQARVEGKPVTTFTQAFADLDRVRAERDPRIAPDPSLGFARVHVARGSDRIVGATIVGAHAGELISEVTLAMDHNIGLGALSSVIHPYPTRSEALRKLGDAYMRGRLTPFKAQLLRRWLGLWRRLPMLALALMLGLSTTMIACSADGVDQSREEAGLPAQDGEDPAGAMDADPPVVGEEEESQDGAAVDGSPIVVPTLAPAVATAEARASILYGADRSPIGPPAAPGWEGKDWPDVLGAATGTTVRWAMWGGDPRINDWVDDYVADVADGRLGLSLEVVPLNDTVDAVNRIAADKTADLEEGSIDLLWVNGENFHTLRQGDLLYGPWAQWTPASSYLDWRDPTWLLDQGVPVEGYEMPWGRAILVLIHDSARLAEPPGDLAALLSWIEDNPGRFTYPAPPDFTGSAFVRQVCATLAPEPGVFLEPVDALEEAAREAALAPCWEALAQITPSLWREGETYPSGLAQQNDLFANGEVDFDLNYNPAAASGFIAEGRYPETTRTFVLADGMLANTHYLAIPWNAPNKAGAMALADLLGQPAAQVSKAQPDLWGDMPVVDPERLSEAWRIGLEELEVGPATLPLDTLLAARRAEPHASWVSVIESGWEREVLGR